MTASEMTLVLLFLYLMRLAHLLIVIVILGYGLNRLMAYWNANIER